MCSVVQRLYLPLSTLENIIEKTLLEFESDETGLIGLDSFNTKLSVDEMHWNVL